jgi:hypothetical protein
MTKPDTLGNRAAQEGCDRCECGCKYWEGDRCIDCGTEVPDMALRIELQDELDATYRCMSHYAGKPAEYNRHKRNAVALRARLYEIRNQPEPGGLTVSRSGQE